MSLAVQASTTALNPVESSIFSATRLEDIKILNVIHSYLGYLTREEVQQFLLNASAHLLTREVVRLSPSLGYINSMNIDRFPLFPVIRECCCHVFNRKSPASIISGFRSALEEVTIYRIKQLYPNKREPLRITSLGSGGCFQELVYIAKLLIREGYSHIDLNLIDQCYATANEFGSNASVIALQRCVQEYISTIAITITAHTDLQTYLTQIEQNSIQRPNLFLMIDLNVAEDLVHTALDVLQRNSSDRDTLTAFTQGSSAACFTVQELPRTRESRSFLTSQMCMISLPGAHGQPIRFVSALGLQSLGLGSSSQGEQEIS